MMKRYSEYKNSSAEWIGEIPSHWTICRMKNLAKIKNGKDQKEVLIEEGGYPVLGTGGEFGRASRFLHKGPSVLLGRKGTIDKPQLIKEAFWTVDTLFYTEIKENVLPDYLFHLVNQIPFSRLQESSAVPSMTQEKLNNVPLCKPPLEEQEKICSFLDHQTSLIDSIISKKEKLIELLKEKRQAVINEAVTKGLDPNAKMKDSGIEWLGEIPEWWDIATLRYMTNKVGSGVTPKGGAEVYSDEGIIFVRSQNVHFEGLRLDDVSFVSEEIHNSMNGSKVLFNDVLLNITGASIGRCCKVDIDEEMNVNQHVCIIRPKEKIDSDYLNFVLQSEIGQIQIKLGTTGGNREGLTFEAIKDFIIPILPLNEQRSIVNFIRNSLSQVGTTTSKISEQIQKLKEYRQSLISEAVTGKIDVREWEPVNKK